ncbi:hypothetical protein M6D81_04475 [Paenibacillus sp. J5C_2022]|uniref:hypothetical protein n=1 Tax=Paenibacillus sp. J5C2022 TaxID=2977129 RepID=UPI0021CFD5DB|nr:hypothetical protein [Paenibacillus sp. J5C2022]MCU6707961.1 hypothetical protein [Paenibacillus sp. J5C2022]
MREERHVSLSLSFSFSSSFFISKDDYFSGLTLTLVPLSTPYLDELSEKIVFCPSSRFPSTDSHSRCNQAPVIPCKIKDFSPLFQEDSEKSKPPLPGFDDSLGTMVHELANPREEMLVSTIFALLAKPVFSACKAIFFHINASRPSKL